MSSSIIDLEEIVETWAWNTFEKTHSKKLKHEDASIDINWSGVSFVPQKPEFSQCGSVKPQSHVVFKSVFKNDSTTPQTHSLKTERQTTASCTSSMTKGCTKGVSVGLTLAAPGDVAEASVGFEKGFSIENAKETSDQKTLTWATEGSLTVKPNSELTAELQVVEKQCSFTFKTKVAIAGRVTVAINNRRDISNLAMSVMGDIREVLLSSNLKEIERGDDCKTVYIKMEGKCDFKYGIEQQIRCY